MQQRERRGISCRGSLTNAETCERPGENGISCPSFSSFRVFRVRQRSQVSHPVFWVCRIDTLHIKIHKCLNCASALGKRRANGFRFLARVPFFRAGCAGPAAGICAAAPLRLTRCV